MWCSECEDAVQNKERHREESVLNRGTLDPRSTMSRSGTTEFATAHYVTALLILVERF